MEIMKLILDKIFIFTTEIQEGTDAGTGIHLLMSFYICLTYLSELLNRLLVGQW